MRILHHGDDHVGACAAGRSSPAYGRAGRPKYEWERVPLRDVSAGYGGDSTRGFGKQAAIMTTETPRDRAAPSETAHCDSSRTSTRGLRSGGACLGLAVLPVYAFSRWTLSRRVESLTLSRLFSVEPALNRSDILFRVDMQALMSFPGLKALSDRQVVPVPHNFSHHENH